VFNTIVVGIDGREGGRDALALAERMRRLWGGELVAVHAYPNDLFASRGETPDFETVMHRNAGELVADELKRAGLRAHSAAMLDGSPGRALHVAAAWHGGDLIVVGSDHHGSIGRVLAGDVTAATLRGARCPVVVAPVGYAQDPKLIETIGVGYDGSPESHRAARLAHVLAAAAGACLRVIFVLEPWVPGGEASASEIDWHEHAEAERERAERVLAELLAELGMVAGGEVVVGDPVTELAYAANDLDLLVTGSRDYGRVRRVMLGSTSSKLVRQAPCPVLVVTRTAVAEELGAAEHRGPRTPAERPREVAAL
jgi:nucleotide-binding universal stress UspA family protein